MIVQDWVILFLSRSRTTLTPWSSLLSTPLSPRGRNRLNVEGVPMKQTIDIYDTVYATHLTFDEREYETSSLHTSEAHEIGVRVYLCVFWLNFLYNCGYEYSRTYKAYVFNTLLQ